MSFILQVADSTPFDRTQVAGWLAGTDLVQEALDELKTSIVGADFADNVFSIFDNLDATKIMDILLDGATTGFTSTLAFTQSAARTITFPDQTATLLTHNVRSNVDFDDNTLLQFGDALDAQIWYDGVDLNIDPDIVGVGRTHFLGITEFDAGVVFNAVATVASPGAIRFNDDISLIFGSALTSRFRYAAGAQTVDAIMLSLDSTGRSFILNDLVNAGKNHDHTAQTNPTIFGHSATDPDVDNTEWWSITHDQTDALLTAGKGNFKSASGFEVGAEFVSTPSADQSLLAATQITANALINRVVGNGGAVTLTGTPTIDATGVSDGTIIIIQGTSDTNTVKLQDEAQLANTDLQLSGGTDFTLGIGDTIQLMYDSGDAKWYEISRSDN